MAHPVARALRVHQTLHGYADGHRLLAHSTKLKPRDQKTMLIMSDASGAGASIEPSGYITGYPLQDSGFYAIARTWPATEMARPGCVWTHTLLLDFADLALLPSMTFLTHEFRRPSENPSFEGYSDVLGVDFHEDGDSVPNIFEDVLKRTLTALYEFPKQKILCPAQNASAQVAFLIWAQQWPRLRRTFRFCTLAFSDRSLEGASFDLQFAPTRERAIRPRFNDVIEIEKTESSSAMWLRDAVRDILSAGAGGLREFLKELGGDLPGGREMFVPLCQLHALVPRFDSAPHLVDDAVTLIDSGSASSSGTALRSLLVASIAQHAESVNARSINFLIQNLELLKYAGSTSQTDMLGRVVWQRNPSSLLRLIDEENLQESWVKHAIATLPTVDIVEKIKQHGDIVPQLATLRPDILHDPVTWGVHSDWNSSVLHQAPNGPMLRAILQADRVDLANEAIEAFGVAELLRVLSAELGSYANPAARKHYAGWLDKVVESRPAIAEYLGEACNKPFGILYEIAVRTSPDAIPNEVGTDPWAIAIRNTSGYLEEKERQVLCGYLLARAFGYRSHSQVELIDFGFDEIYFGAFNNRLSDDAWRFLQESLPRSWVRDWDRCQKLRDAVTEMYVNRHLPPESFSKITRDDSLFAELARLASYTSRGRKYLKKVLQYMRDNGGSISRAESIEKLFWW